MNNDSNDFSTILDKDLKYSQKLNYSNISQNEILSAINNDNRFSIERAKILLSEKALNYIEQMAEKSLSITRQRFGNVINIFTPMYLNNFCINGCSYCGFNKDSESYKQNIEVNSGKLRTRLSIDDAVKEAKAIKDMGISQLLLVAGEDPRSVNVSFIVELAKKIRPWFSSIGIELQPFSTDEYKQMKEAGVDYVAFYQETYNKELYKVYHKKGPKSDYKRRIENIDIIGSSKMSKIGMGVLLGLDNFEKDMLSLVIHINYVIKKYTFSQIVVSFPRIQPSASTSEYQRIVKEHNISNISETKLAQAMFVIRLLFNDIGITLSTRESEEFRNNMIPLTVTNISAASKTSPGALTQKENDNLDQFSIQDDRSLLDIKEMLENKGLEPLMYERQYERI